MYPAHHHRTAAQNPFVDYFSSNARDSLPARPPVVEPLPEADEDQFRPQRQTVPIPAPPIAASAPTTMSPAAMFLSTFMSAPQPALRPDDEGQVISGYTLGPIIGYGASSIIRRASSSSGNISAVKIIRRSDLVKAGNAPQARRRLQHEATVWASLSHEHILPLFSAVHTPHADYFFTLCCPAGSLFDILQRDGTPALLQDDAGMMFRQVVRGLRYLHEEARYVHRDMKLENVLVDEMGVCKIGDFGMTKRIYGTGAGESDEDDGQQQQQELSPLSAELVSPTNGTVHRAVSMTATSLKMRGKNDSGHLINHNLARFNTVRHRNSTSTNQPSLSLQPGSLPYAAPELLLPHTSECFRPHPGQDIWALGVMLYALLAGRLPFSDNFEPRLQMKILNGQYECPKDIGRGAERILQGCLERSVANRWTIAMVDEVGWGVGWGAEGDDATPSDAEELPMPSAQTSRSQSRTRPADIIIPSSSNPDWQYEEPRARPSLNTASRRSSSRAKRSLSRAPALTDRSTSTRSAGRSMSRHPRGISPSSASATRPDPFSASSMISCITSSPSPYEATFDESALLISPTSSITSSIVHRGRRPSKAHQSHSRSPSPSVVPTTPRDGPLDLHLKTSATSGLSLATAAGLLEQPEELHLDLDAETSARGRTTIRSSFGAEDGGHVHVAGKARAAYGQLEDGWAVVHDDGEEDVEDTMQNMVIRQTHRPSSSPPTTAPRAQTKDSATRHKAGTDTPFLNPLGLSVHSTLIQRSRSAEDPR